LSTLKGGEEKIFQLSVDKTLWEKWGLCYPVTYLFETSDLSSITVSCCDTVSDPWQNIPTKTETDFYNGIEVVRIDNAQHLIYVSVGFKKNPTIFIKFNSPGKVTYKSITRYYDNRKATYTVSLDNWGSTLHSGTCAGVTCTSPTDDNGDKYQAAIWALRSFKIPVSVASNTRSMNMTTDRQFKECRVLHLYSI
jgi:hypothetical protein